MRWSLIGSFLFLCASSAFAQAPQKIHALFYNVYNLFDVEHDAGKDDWTFLPADYPEKQEACEKINQDYYREECLKLDWTEAKLETKLKQLAKVIKAAPILPDFVGLAEVENVDVVERLAKKIGFKQVIISNSDDDRGIDVVLMIREPQLTKVIDVREIKVPVNFATRPVLQVKLKIRDHRLNVFVNHWPSQSSPATTRDKAAQVVRQAVDEMQRVGEDSLVMGDFNTTADDRPQPFQRFRGGLVEISSDYADKPEGTYFYVGGFNWVMLDRFFANKDHQFHECGYRIVAETFMRKDFTYTHGDHDGEIVRGIPWRGNHYSAEARTAGFADHFPIYTCLIFH